MKIFITGITGFVASHMVDYLLSNVDCEIYGLLRWRSDKDNIKHFINDNKVFLCYGDLLDFSSIYKMINKIKPDIIYHFAAQSVAEDEFIPILKSKNMDIYTFKELWDISSKRNIIEIVNNNGIDTEIINIKNNQIRAISFFDGMGNWLPIKQISRHKYKGEIVELKQKYGSIKVTPNHCVIDKYSKLCSSSDNPDVLPMRKLNYYNKKIIKKILLKRNRKYKNDGSFFYIPNVCNKKLPIFLENEKLESFSYFCAAYIAEGCAHSRRKKRNFIVNISNNSKEWLEERNKELKIFSEGMDGKYHIGKKKGYKDTFNLVITSELLYKIMVEYCGKGSKFKKIPSFIFNMPKEIQMNFLRILVEGDGNLEKRKLYNVLRYTTISRRLAAQVCLLLTILEKDYTVHEDAGAFFIRECEFYQPHQGRENKKIYKSDYDGYVYDISVGSPEVFAVGVGNLIVHNSLVPYSFEVPSLTLETNIIGTCSLLESIKIIKEKESYDPITVIVSSSEVYGQVCEENVPITEDCPLNPASPYAVSKVGEDMLGLQYWLSYKIKTIRTRLFSHEGPRRGEFFATSAFAKQIAKIEKNKQEPVIKVGNLDSIRTFMDVRDAVYAYWLLVNKCKYGEVYNIGGNITMTIGDMLNKLLNLSTQKDIKIEIDPLLLRPSDVTLQIPCSDKFKKETGWEPRISFEKTLEDLLNFWRDKLCQK